MITLGKAICMLALIPALAMAEAEKPKHDKMSGKEAKKIKLTTDSSFAETRKDGLKITDLKKGTGAEARLGKKISVKYRGTFAKNGKEFDATKGDPITFDLLEGRLIKGWTEGIPGMKVGGKRKLYIPYAMAYGERGTPDGTIPAKEDLEFEVELVEVK